MKGGYRSEMEEMSNIFVKPIPNPIPIKVEAVNYDIPLPEISPILLFLAI